MEITFLLSKWCIVKVDVILWKTLSVSGIRNITGVINISLLIRYYSLRWLNRLNLNHLLLLLVIISITLKFWIKVSFSSILNYWWVFNFRCLDLNLLWYLGYWLILNISLILKFVLFGISNLLFGCFIWHCFIFYSSLNYDFLLFKSVFYLRILLLLLFLFFFIWILCILHHTYCFLSDWIFSPFFLSNLRLLLFFLCSWYS